MNIRRYDHENYAIIPPRDIADVYKSLGLHILFSASTCQRHGSWLQTRCDCTIMRDISSQMMCVIFTRTVQLKQHLMRCIAGGISRYNGVSHEYLALLLSCYRSHCFHVIPVRVRAAADPTTCTLVCQHEQVSLSTLSNDFTVLTQIFARLWTSIICTLRCFASIPYIPWWANKMLDQSIDTEKTTELSNLILSYEHCVDSMRW